jgi:ADP-heptose:LPS heptosyltransferase
MPKLLFIRFSSIGDIVLTSPLLRCTNKQLKNAEIHFLTLERYKNLVAHNPNIDFVHTWEECIKTSFSNLRKEKFDILIDLHKNLRSLRVKLNIISVKSFSFQKLNLEKYLMVNFKMDRLPEKHIVDRYFETLKKINVHNDNEGLDFFIAPEAVNYRNALPFSFNHHDYVAICIGAQHATKRMPKEKLRILAQNINRPILLLGGKEDFENGEFIAAEDENVFNACGKLSIHQSAAAVKEASCVITHDTGMMHIAAAFGKPIITIWGNTIPKFGMYAYPKNNDSVVYNMEVKGLKCRPCSKIGFQRCPKDHFNCMNQQNPEKIVSLVNAIKC